MVAQEMAPTAERTYRNRVHQLPELMLLELSKRHAPA
jgi:hypothetical protein